jgi:predicted acyl esterase
MNNDVNTIPKLMYSERMFVVVVVLRRGIFGSKGSRSIHIDEKKDTATTNTQTN